jgi:hypothetical protein
MPSPLTRDDLEALARIPAPALANPIETFGVRPNNTGFTGPEIRPLFPELGAMVGFACTLRLAAERPPEPKTAGAPLSAGFTPARLAEVWNDAVGRWPGPAVRPPGEPGML